MPAYGYRDHSIYPLHMHRSRKAGLDADGEVVNEPNNTLFGFSLADDNGQESDRLRPDVSGLQLLAFGSQDVDVTLGPGKTPTLSAPILRLVLL